MKISTPPSTVTSAVSEAFDRRYLLRRLLARSAGALVYAADHKFTRRQVALKIPHAAVSSQACTRVRREIEALCVVRGEGVVDMLDAGEVAGRPYIVFELLEGRTLTGLLAARGQLNAEEVVKVGVDTARALARCHEQGVIHRDIKPSNLFLTLGDCGSVKLLDFGIAKLARTESAPGPKLAEDSAVLGTPEYMAPESLMGSLEIDQRADVYGLGVTLFECLTGSVPFEGKHTEVLSKLSTEARPSIRTLRADAPEALCKVIERCLEREPDQRFQDMNELRAALEAELAPSEINVSLISRPGAPERKESDTMADAPVAKQKSGSEGRRLYARAPYITLARITPENGPRVDGRIEEVSEGGTQFVGDRPIESGAVVKIRFALPISGRVTEVVATSRWHRSVHGNNASGLEFDDLGESARDEIRQYVEIMGRD